jgi:hypothetical protein
VNDDDTSRSPSAEELAASLAEQVHQIIRTAERAAVQLRADAEVDAQDHASQIRLAAEEDAARLLRRAEDEARDYLDDARRRVDAFAQGRARRMAAAADRLLVHVEALAARTERAARLKHGIDAVIDALAAAAEAVAAEAQRGPIELPGPGDPGAVVTRLTTRPHAVPDPEPQGAPAPHVTAAPEPRPPADDAREHVRRIASALPRRPKPAGAPKRTPPPTPPGDDAA